MELSKSGKVQKRYIRGNDLVYADKGEDTERQYYVTDPHGNVVQLTDESGKVTKVYEYDSFGNEVKPDGKDDNPFRYCGEYYDKETAEIYLRARYYQPAVGRFMTRDSYTGEDDEPLSLHLYTYCENDGVNAWDPSGYVKFYYGQPKEPKYVFDDDFPYNSKKGKDTFRDRVSWRWWGTKLSVAKRVYGKEWKEATETYEHYRDATGTTKYLNYSKAYRQDSYYKKKNNELIRKAQKYAVKCYKEKKEKCFSIYSNKYHIKNGTSENWQKAIGAHNVWLSAVVEKKKKSILCIQIYIFEINIISL